jgi:hypothetical protein
MTLRAGSINAQNKKGKHELPFFGLKMLALLSVFGAGNETRTRDLNLGKVALYQLSYTRISDNKPVVTKLVAEHEF